MPAMRYSATLVVAWGWSGHVEHERTVIWLAAARKQKATLLLTSAIPELGFVRVSVQRTGGRVTVKEASKTLAGMLGSLGYHHAFLPTTVHAVTSRSGATMHRGRRMPTFSGWQKLTGRSWPRSILQYLGHFWFSLRFQTADNRDEHQRMVPIGFN